jgi:hypothetical protein
MQFDKLGYTHVCIYRRILNFGVVKMTALDGLVVPAGQQPQQVRRQFIVVRDAFQIVATADRKRLFETKEC